MIWNFTNDCIILQSYKLILNSVIQLDWLTDRNISIIRKRSFLFYVRDIRKSLLRILVITRSEVLIIRHNKHLNLTPSILVFHLCNIIKFIYDQNLTPQNLWKLCSLRLFIFYLVFFYYSCMLSHYICELLYEYFLELLCSHYLVNLRQ